MIEREKNLKNGIRDFINGMQNLPDRGRWCDSSGKNDSMKMHAGMHILRCLIRAFCICMLLTFLTLPEDCFAVEEKTFSTVQPGRPDEQNILLRDTFQNLLPIEVPLRGVEQLKKRRISPETIEGMLKPDNWSISWNTFTPGCRLTGQDGYWRISGANGLVLNQYSVSTTRTRRFRISLTVEAADDRRENSKVTLGIVQYDTLQSGKKNLIRQEIESGKTAMVEAPLFFERGTPRFRIMLEITGDVILKEMVLTELPDDLARDGITLVEGTVDDCSEIPDPQISDYPDCRFTMSFAGNRILRGASCPRRIELQVDGFLKRRLLPTVKLKKGDRIRCYIMPFERLSESQRSTRQADDLELYMLESYYLLECETIKWFQHETEDDIPFSDENREEQEQQAQETGRAISYAVSQREKHAVYKGMALPLIIFIQLSFIGYLNFIRRKIRIHWTNAVLFGVCFLAVLMMISGMLHIIKAVTYIVFFGGLLSLCLQLFRSNRKWSLPTMSVFRDMVFRPEYVLLLCASIGTFVLFMNCSVEAGEGDTWTAWYQNFLYIMENGRWADSGYKNYASAYAMIINGIAGYYAFLLHDSGTQMWTWGHLWFSIMMLAPVFRKIEWRHIHMSEIIMIPALILFQRLYGNTSTLICYYAVAILIMFFAVLNSENKKLRITNSMMFFLGVLLGLYVVLSSGIFVSYPMDNLLGCAVLGIFFSLAWKLLDFGELNWKILFWTIPLIVLALIKPTGSIPSAILSLCLAFGIIIRVCIAYRRTERKKRLLVIASLAFVIILGTPWLTTFLWNRYSALNGLQYQHKVSVNTLLTQAKKQFDNGCTDSELANWRKRIWKMSLISGYSLINANGQEIKSPVEKFLETQCRRYFTKHPFFDFDTCFAKPFKGSSHVAIVSLLLLSAALVCTFLVKQKAMYIFLIVWAVLTYAIFVFNQYYLAPMFTRIPGLFRYFYPAYVIILGLSFCGLFQLFLQQKLWAGMLVSCFLLFSLSPHFLSKVPFYYDSSLDPTQSWTGYIMVARANAGPEAKFHFANTHREGACYRSSTSVFIRDESDQYFLPHHLPKKLDEEQYFEVVVSGLKSKTWEYQSVQEPGIYLAEPDKNTHTIKLTPVFCNRDAAALFNKAYSFSDLDSWKRPPWIEREIGNVEYKQWTSDCGAVLEDSGKLTIPQAEETIRLCNTAANFCFAHDSIRLTGRISNGMELSGTLRLYEKTDTDQRFIFFEKYPMKIRITPVDEGMSTFTADFRLSDIKTDKLNLYYNIQLDLKSNVRVQVSDLHLYQYISGKLNLPQLPLGK